MTIHTARPRPLSLIVVLTALVDRGNRPRPGEHVGAVDGRHRRVDGEPRDRGSLGNVGCRLTDHCGGDDNSGDHDSGNTVIGDR
jgi:hypothetical protein